MRNRADPVAVAGKSRLCASSFVLNVALRKRIQFAVGGAAAAG
jgi:hypothetical protein